MDTHVRVVSGSLFSILHYPFFGQYLASTNTHTPSPPSSSPSSLPPSLSLLPSLPCSLPLLTHYCRMGRGIEEWPTVFHLSHRCPSVLGTIHLSEPLHCPRWSRGDEFQSWWLVQWCQTCWDEWSEVQPRSRIAIIWIQTHKFCLWIRYTLSVRKAQPTYIRPERIYPSGPKMTYFWFTVLYYYNVIIMKYW